MPVCVPCEMEIDLNATPQLMSLETTVNGVTSLFGCLKNVNYTIQMM